MEQIRNSNPDSLHLSSRTVWLEPGCNFPSENAPLLLGNSSRGGKLKMLTQPFLRSLLLQGMHKLLHTLLLHGPSGLTALLFSQQ